MLKSSSRVQAPAVVLFLFLFCPGLQTAAAVVQRSLVLEVSVLSSDHSRLEVVGDQPASSSTHSTKVKLGNGHHHCSFEAFSHVLDIPQFDNIFHQNHNQSDAACMVAVF